MLLSEAKEYLKLMDQVFKGGNLTENVLAKEEYLKRIVKLDLSIFAKTFDLLSATSKFFPTISEINEAYEKVLRIEADNKKFLEPDTNCYICQNKGFIHYKKDSIEFITYCECEYGKTFIYDGRQNKDHKSEYHTKSVKEIFTFAEIEEMKDKNMFKKHDIVPMPDYAKKALREFTRNFGRTQYVQKVNRS